MMEFVNHTFIDGRKTTGYIGANYYYPSDHKRELFRLASFGKWTAHFIRLSTGESWTVTDNIYPDMKLDEQQTKLF